MDFAPPSGPPPPKVPEGWKAQWNDQYSEWFYVNIYTKKSQWDKPTEPVYPHPVDGAPAGPPPGYPAGGSDLSHGTTDTKHNPYDHPPNAIESDEALARRLQAEEDARNAPGSSHRGAQQDYMNTPMGQQQGVSPYPQQDHSPYPQQPYYDSQQSQYPEQLPPRDQKKSGAGGLLGKLLSKASGSGGGHSSFKPPQQQYGGYGQQGYGQSGYGGYPQQGFGRGGFGGGGGYGGGGYGQPKKSGGMGMAGGAALGLGGGLIGGAVLANALDDDDDDYREGYQDGQQDDDNGGGDDFGGGDDGGD